MAHLEQATGPEMWSHVVCRSHCGLGSCPISCSSFIIPRSHQCSQLVALSCTFVSPTDWCFFSGPSGQPHLVLPLLQETCDFSVVPTGSQLTPLLLNQTSMSSKVPVDSPILRPYVIHRTVVSYVVPAGGTILCPYQVLPLGLLQPHLALQ